MDQVSSSFASSDGGAPPPPPPRKKKRHIPPAFRKEREAAYGDLPRETLLSTLIESQYECFRTRKAMHIALERLREENAKVEAAYAFSEELVERLTVLHTQKAELRAQVNDAREAVERWRVEYGHVRGRVEEGERVLEDVRGEVGEARRREREARRDAWRAERERVEVEAIEEGRRRGMVDGYRRAVGEVGRRRRIVEDEEEDEEEEEEEGRESSFYARPVVTGEPPPIVPIPTEHNSPPATPVVEHWTMDVPPPARTPPENLIPVVPSDGSTAIVLPPPHEFDGSMRASSPNHRPVSLRAPSDSTTMSNLRITRESPNSTPIGISIHHASPASPRLPPAHQFQLSRTDEWDQSAQSDATSFRNPDITPFDPGLTPSIRRFERLPNSRPQSNNFLSPAASTTYVPLLSNYRPRSVKSNKSRLSVVNPDPPASLHHRRSTLSQRTHGQYDHWQGTPTDDPAMWGATR